MASSLRKSGSSLLDLSTQRFHDAYLAACESKLALDELKLSACAFVRDLRDQGVPPEQVIIRVKAALSDSDRSYSAHNHPDARQKLADDVISWCIEEYYAVPPK